mmetsp:Transcript_101930/g.293546  ORF Transcript_101930/g.293546 Transcript_101930/m.293546 type:complete len:241 (-) Transcript_101930:314-1036(-)
MLRTMTVVLASFPARTIFGTMSNFDRSFESTFSRSGLPGPPPLIVPATPLAPALAAAFAAEPSALPPAAGILWSAADKLTPTFDISSMRPGGPDGTAPVCAAWAAASMGPFKFIIIIILEALSCSWYASASLEVKAHMAMEASRVSSAGVSAWEVSGWQPGRQRATCCAARASKNSTTTSSPEIETPAMSPKTWKPAKCGGREAKSRVLMLTFRKSCAIGGSSSARSLYASSTLAASRMS